MADERTEHGADDDARNEGFASSDRIRSEDRESTPVPDPEPDDAPDAPTDVVETAPEPSTEAPADEQPMRPSRPGLVPILAAATAVCFVAAVLFGLMAFVPRFAPIKSGPAKLAVEAQDDKDAVDVASRFAKNFLSIDYRTLDADFERLIADATGTLKDGLERTLSAIGDAFKKQKTSTEAKVRDSLLLDSDGDTVRVQVLLDRTKRNVETKGKPVTEQRVVNVTVVKTSDGWKASALQEVTPEALIDSRTDPDGS